MSYTIAGRVIKTLIVNFLCQLFRLLSPPTSEKIATTSYLFIRRSVLGTIASTIGIVVAASGGSDKSASSKPVPVSEDKTISGQTPEEEDL
nr:hypothetical protein L204_00487 [Cryptococcus depauperatus CBS 7855]